MATQTRGANTGVNELGFTDPSNVTSEDVVCASAAGSDLDEMYCTFLAGSITSSSFDAFHFQVVAGIFYAGGGFVARVSKDGGSTYCSGHDIRSLIPSAACAGVGSTGWVLCSHSQAPSSEADWEQTDNRIRLSRGTGNSTLFVDYVEIRATYTPIVVPDAPTWAAQPFPLANRDLTELEVDWVAPAGGDAPTGYDLQWDTDSSFPTPPTQMIDVGLVTIYNHTGRSSGTRYYYRIRGYNTVGDGAWTATESTYTEPVQPTGLAVANTVAQRLDLSWNAVTVSPAGTVLYDIQWDTDGSPGGETNLSLNQSAITVNHTVGADNTLRYYWVRAQSPDVDGNGTTEGQYNTKVSGTTWSVPNTENLSTATTPDDSMILITRDGSYPSGGSGNPPEGVDTWEVWRSTSSDGAYSELVTGLTATTYEDWSVNGGETWYYKAKFTNLIGDSALSTNPVSNTATTPEVQQSFGENVPADSAYSYDTTNEANDDIGTRDFNDTGVSITYSNSGGVFSQGYADLPGSGGYLQANPSQITTENWWITTWVNPDVFVNSTLLMGVQTSTASHYVLLYMNGTSGGVRVDINKTGTGFRTNTWTSTLSTSSWQLITLAYDHSTTTVYFSDGNTLESYQHDLGALNFGNGFIRMGGGGPAIYNGQYSNTLLWENELPTVARLDQLLADGDLVSAAAPQDGFDSDTRIKVIDNLIEPLSDTAIYQEGWDTKDKLSDTAIYQEGWDTIEPLSDTRIKVIDNLIEPTIDPLNNGDFETGTHGNIPPTDWDAGNGKQDSNALFVQAGSLGVRLVLGSNPYSAAYIEQNVNFPVTNFVSMTLWLKSANLTQQTVFTYTDDSTTTIDHGSVGTQWEQKTILITDLDSGQIVKTIKIESIGSGAPNIAAVDEIVLTLNNEEIGSNTRIFVPDNLIESLSDTAIYQPGWDTIEPTSDTRIRNTFEITKLSDSTVLKIGEVSRVSNTTISKAGIEITKISETAIFREGFVTLDITSDSRVKLTSQKITYLSDSRIKNTYEQSPLSDSTIFRSQYGDIQVSSDARIVFEGTVVLPSILSDSRIKTASEFTKTSDTFIVLGFEINKLSDTAIFQADYGDITKTSDTAIFADQYGDITKLSDATIFKSGLLIDKLSDTRIFRPGGYMYPLQDQEKTSDTRILALGQEITKKSLTRIKDDSNDITKLSDTLIMLHPVINKTSDTKIKFIDNALLILSSTRIKNTLELNPTSDAAIFRSQYGDITKLSDTLILREPIINKTSDTTIVKLFEFSGILSDTYIINIGTQIDINSNTAIFRAGYGQILKESRTAIKQFGLEKTKLSNTRITKTITLNKVSDTAIRRDRSPIVVIFEKGRQL